MNNPLDCVMSWFIHRFIFTFILEFLLSLQTLLKKKKKKFSKMVLLCARFSLSRLCIFEYFDFGWVSQHANHYWTSQIDVNEILNSSFDPSVSQPDVIKNINITFNKLFSSKFSRSIFFLLLLLSFLLEISLEIF